MRLSLFQRRTIWFPTFLGWLALATVVVAPALLWCFKGEAYLSSDQRLPAEILVVEGWIGSDGIRAAGDEFERGGYSHIVTTSSVAALHWDSRHESYAVVAARELVRDGIPPEKILVAPARDTERQRTYESAAAVWRALHENNLHPPALNVFTMGVHARRSRLVFAKVFGSESRIGAISWMPSSSAGEAWWHSSERASDLLKETVGCFLEVVFDSFRSSNSPIAPPAGKPGNLPDR